MATGSDKNIGITVSATDKTKKALTGVQKNLKKTTNEASTLSSRFRNMARATAAIEGPLGGTAGRLSVIATLLGSANIGMVAFSAGMTAMTLVAGLAIKRFGDFEEQTLKVEQMLKTTGNASGLTAKEIEELADSIGEATLQSRNGVLEASAVLMSFKSIAGDSFRSTMEVAADMSALMGTDLKSSVVQLGKALEDPTKGLSALSRSGISFSEAQKQLIVDMSEVGDAAGAQAEILRILQGQLGGAGAAAGGGLSGALDLVSHGWDKWLVQLASTGAGEAATAMIKQIGRGMDNVANKMDDTFNTEQKHKALLVRRVELLNIIEALEGKSGRSARSQRAAAERMLKVVTERANKLTFMILDEEKAKKLAEEGAATTKVQLKLDADRATAKKEQLKVEKELEKQRDKEKAAAVKFGEGLALESQKLSDSFLTKEQQENEYYNRKLMKIDEFRATNAASQEEANKMEYDAKLAHELRLTDIEAVEKDNREKADAKIDAVRLKAASTAAGNLATLMNTNSKKLFKIGKAAALTQAIIDGYAAATASFKNAGGYPWGVVAAAASMVATGVQIANIKAQQFGGAREFGGSVVGGRTYMVGERGPELFTAPNSGNIITNNLTESIGGGSNTINVYQTIEHGDKMIERNAAAIWNVVLDKMNQEGFNFA